MRKLLLVCVSGAGALVMACLLLVQRPGLVEDGIDWARSLGPSGSRPVLVLLVADRSGVAVVRAAVDPARILAETADAIVLREGRVVATGPGAVGGPLTEAGFANRSIEVWAATRPRPSKREEKTDEELSLAALAKKPTLTPLEVLAILNGSVTGVGI